MSAAPTIIWVIYIKPWLSLTSPQNRAFCILFSSNDTFCYFSAIALSYLSKWLATFALVRSMSLAPLVLFLAVILPFSPGVYAARTKFSDTSCTIEGDSDVLGIGIRVSFYLQWFSTVILLLFAPAEADVARKSSVILSAALLLSAFRAMAEGALIVFDWPLILMMIIGSCVWNIPTSKAECRRNGGTLSALALLFAAILLASPWVSFIGVYNGAKKGCDIRIAGIPVFSAYSKRAVLSGKIISVFGAVIGGPIYVAGAVWAGTQWIGTWTSRRIDDYEQRPNPSSAIQGILQLIIGIIAVAIIERTLVINNVVFLDTTVMSTGQLIPLSIGIVTIVSSLGAALKSMTRYVFPSSLSMLALTDWN